MKISEAPLQFNRILDDKARRQYQGVIKWLFKLCPEMMKRKVPRANIQQGFVLHTVQHFYRPGAKVLCVGSFEDTAFEALKRLGVEMEEIDPVNNYDLNGFYHLPTTKKASYDIVFSTSVIEHVEQDDLFLNQIQGLLAQGGIGILTCDFKGDYKEGDYIFPGNFRFYTQGLLLAKMERALSECELVDTSQWECLYPDFFFEGQNYTFATLTFRKK
jgi:SAM-dependent methyltransferase